jgi:hypothetical protein
MQVLSASLPWVDFPKSYDVSEVGLGYQTIHVWKFD